MLPSLDTQASAQGRACHSKLGSRGRHVRCLSPSVGSLRVVSFETVLYRHGFQKNRRFCESNQLYFKTSTYTRLCHVVGNGQKTSDGAVNGRHRPRSHWVEVFLLPRLFVMTSHQSSGHLSFVSLVIGGSRESRSRELMQQAIICTVAVPCRYIADSIREEVPFRTQYHSGMFHYYSDLLLGSKILC